jgi:hypothetical protein
MHLANTAEASEFLIQRTDDSGGSLLSPDFFGGGLGRLALAVGMVVLCFKNINRFN